MRLYQKILLKILAIFLKNISSDNINDSINIHDNISNLKRMKLIIKILNSNQYKYLHTEKSKSKSNGTNVEFTAKDAKCSVEKKC